MGVKNDMEAPAPPEEICNRHLYLVSGLSATSLEKMAQEPSSDFEAAISATGFGKFNALLMLFSFTAFWASCAITAAPTFIFTQAQCDLDLSLLDMGTVGAMTYSGMMCSAFFWGFLSDTLGRKKIMVYGFLLTSVVETVAAMTQSFTMLLTMRFISGFIFNGPYTVVISYIAELHRTELRARVMLLTSLFYTIANITLPLLAWAVLRHDLDLYIFGNKFVIHSWNLFLLSAALMPLVSGVSFMFMPESPKFLMSRGRNDEAMAAFKWIFSMNTGRPAEEYPIKTLVAEISEKQATGVDALRGGISQLMPLFKSPHIKWLILICTMHCGCMFGNNTLRLWYPQLAAMIGSSAEQGLCSALAPTAPPPVGETCVTLQPDLLTYLQSTMVGSGSLLTYGIGGAIVNKCGKKVVVGFCGLMSASLVVALPFLGSSPGAVTAMMATVLSFTALAGATLSSVCVDLFPTSLRVMALTTFMMTGRIGTIAGTVAFPALVQFGCLPPFFTIAAVLSVSAIALVSLLPNTTLKKLE